MYEWLDAMYRAHAAELTAALALSTGDRQAAEDLTHEVFVRAMARGEELLAHPNPRGWLFRTGYNLASNRWKLLARRRHRVAQEHPVLSAADWDATIDLRESLRQLSPRQRDTVILHHYLGFSVEEIADLLGCAEGSVKAHLSRGRHALDAMLRPTEAIE
ncbi:MAG: RNA polymerase sigma factor [Chloroflexota bacterium]|nr:RNA polymerase sigma factor [Chloroflexota bacterium]